MTDATRTESGDDYRSIWKYLYRTPHKLDWIDVDGVSTRYVELGDPSAPTLVLLHGTAGSLENFCANLAPLAKDFHVLALDMLGCGWTAKPDFPYTALDYAQHVRRFMDAKGVNQAGFIGVSLGAWIACRIAADTPERVSRIIAVAPAGIVTNQEEAQRVVEGIRQRRNAAAAMPTWSTITTIFERLVLKPVNIVDDLVAVRLGIYQNPAMQANMGNLLHMTNLEYSLEDKEWRELGQPILLIAAVDAPNTFLENAIAIHRRAPHAELLEMKGCDHWAQFECPDEFNAAAIAFFSGKSVGAKQGGPA